MVNNVDYFCERKCSIFAGFDLFEMNMFEVDSHLDDDISSFIEQNSNVNTTKKTKTDLSRLKR